MKRFVTLALVGALVLGASSIVYANVCAFDAVPAATILFPFVAYDYDGDRTTLFSITNVSSEAQVVHVTVWTDFSAAILDFNIILTGYDVISMNIGEILGGGQLPITKYEPHTGTEGVEPNGPVSPDNTSSQAFWVNNALDLPEPTSPTLLGRCDTTNNSYPGLYVTKINPGFLGLFEGYLKVSQMADRLHSNDCTKPFAGPYSLSPEPYWVGRVATDPTWMYITADVVENCNKLFPDTPTYFDNEVRFDNVLIGDMFWTSVSERLSEAMTAVMIEASMYLDSVVTHTPDGLPISFYYRYAQLLDGVSDYREPLPTSWAMRYLGAGNPDIGTDIRLWKGSTEFDWTNDLERVGAVKVSPDDLVASNCHAYTYYAWDEDEMVTTVAGVPWSMPGGEEVIPNLLPLETQEIPIEQFDTPGEFGWMLFVWPASNYFDGGAGLEDDYYQTWMGVKYSAFGQWSAAMHGAVMANYNCFSDQVLPNLGIGYEYADEFGYYVPPGNAPPVGP